MSNPFQVGDTLRVLPTEAQPLHGLHANTHVTVEHADETHVRVSGSTYEWHARRFELVKRADATPAPIDPHAVKPGDTVTVRFIETGDEITTKAYRPEDITAGRWVSVLGWPLVKADGTFGLAVKFFELIAHQPAPEPEVEWADGTFGDALVDGVSVRGFIANGGESFVFPLPDGGYHEVGHGAYSDFAPDETRPLPTREQRADVVDLLIAFSNDRADEWDTADKILALLSGGAR